MKTVGDSHRFAAYRNKHCWRAFREHQHWWPWTTRGPWYPQNGIFNDFSSWFQATAHISTVNCAKISAYRPGVDSLCVKFLAQNVGFNRLVLDLLCSRSPLCGGLKLGCTFKTNHSFIARCTPISQVAARMLSRVTWAVLRLLVALQMLLLCLQPVHGAGHLLSMIDRCDVIRHVTSSNVTSRLIFRNSVFFELTLKRRGVILGDCKEGFTDPQGSTILIYDFFIFSFETVLLLQEQDVA